MRTIAAASVAVLAFAGAALLLRDDASPAASPSRADAKKPGSGASLAIGPAPTSSTSRTSGRERGDATEREPVSRAIAPAEQGETSPAGVRELAVAGRTLDAAGAPIGGARVELLATLRAELGNHC